MSCEQFVHRLKGYSGTKIASLHMKKYQLNVIMCENKNIIKKKKKT